VDAVLSQIYDQVKMNILGGNADESSLQKALDDARPKIEQMLSLSDRLEGASTPAAQQSALTDTIKFIEANGGNKMAVYPYLAQKGFDPEVLKNVGIDPKDIETVANNIKAQTPATQADLSKLTDSQKEQIQALQAMIAELQARIQELLAQQQQMQNQLAMSTDAMVAGPNTRPTEGLAPTLGATAPAGSTTANNLSNQLRIPLRV
jgi:hypothetical protein